MQNMIQNKALQKRTYTNFHSPIMSVWTPSYSWHRIKCSLSCKTFGIAELALFYQTRSELSLCILQLPRNVPTIHIRNHVAYATSYVHCYPFMLGV
jgi:hypothetical protein